MQRYVEAMKNGTKGVPLSRQDGEKEETIDSLIEKVRAAREGRKDTTRKLFADVTLMQMNLRRRGQKAQEASETLETQVREMYRQRGVTDEKELQEKVDKALDSM